MVSPHPVVVQKFGGSSLSDVEKIRRVAAKVKARREAGAQLVVVVSAMGDTTDELLGLAKQISADPPRRELDMLLTCGERISMALLSMALQELGVPAISFTGSQSGIITDEAHAQARVVEVRPQRIEGALAAGRVVIVAGYQGVSREREVTTLGRGGSDTTAVALAAALGADCEIYSDVDGVLSADPRVVPDAHRLEAVSFDEMEALAASGAKVLNPQAVELARRSGIVIQARSAHGSGPGTEIRASAPPSRVRGVTADEAIWVAAVKGDPSGLLATLHRLQLRPRAILGDTSGRTLIVVSLEDAHRIPAASGELPPDAEGVDDLATVTVVGHGLYADGSIALEVAAVAAELGVRPIAWSSSALQLTVVVPRTAAKALTGALHRRLGPR